MPIAVPRPPRARQRRKKVLRAKKYRSRAPAEFQESFADIEAQARRPRPRFPHPWRRHPSGFSPHRRRIFRGRFQLVHRASILGRIRLNVCKSVSATSLVFSRIFLAW